MLDQIRQAGIERIVIVVHPDDVLPYSRVAGPHGGSLEFVPQPEARGYAHAVFSAREAAGDEAFLHLVGDHLHVSRTGTSCARTLVDTARAEACAVSAVQATRETLLPHYGTIGGRRISGKAHLLRVEKVVEKPTPTEAEQHLIIPGMRAGHYYCFFGMHVLTPLVWALLERRLAAAADPRTVLLSDVLHELAGREHYLALEMTDARYDLGEKYGLLQAQLALALNGIDREEVIAHIIDLLAHRELSPDRPHA
jgi:UTP--glucose-1-phosphate uridylyltransferase